MIPQNEHSEFWAGKIDLDKIDVYTLLMYKRGISNFVNILTGKSYPVKFYEEGDSMTDGKRVIISSDIKNEGLDRGVGLSLHEAAHILKTDFELLNNLFIKIPPSIFDKGINVGMEKIKVTSELKNFWNYVEDLYIDYFIYSTSPGYRKYYQRMYECDWNSPVVSSGLSSNLCRDLDLHSYKFRVFNFTNPYTDLDALPGLRQIYNKINFGNIQRLQTPIDRLDLANEIFEMILDELPHKKDKPKYFSMDSETYSTDTISSSSNWPSNFEMSELEDNISGSSNLDNVDPKDKEEISSEDQKLKQSIDEHLEKQENFLKGNVHKNTIDEKDLRTLNVLDESKAEFVDIEFSNKNTPVRCIVINKLTQNLIDSDVFPLSYDTYGYKFSEEAVQDGISLGKVLSKKLKIRNETRTTIYNRQKKGKMDQRMVHSLGFENEDIFFSKNVDMFNDASVHISVDASSSMSGKKWKSALSCCVAIAFAATKIENLDVTISFRTTKDHFPYIVIGYNSKFDKFSKIRSLFPNISPHGYTPEGLCYQAIMEKIPPSRENFDSYFLNFSDGEPYFPNVRYFGETAVKQTRKQIDIFHLKKIDVLSYFINSEDIVCNKTFVKMYGKNSEFIDVCDVKQVAKTMNEKFIKKS